jgi:hypothetical protein
MHEALAGFRQPAEHLRPAGGQSLHPEVRWREYAAPAAARLSSRSTASRSASRASLASMLVEVAALIDGAAKRHPPEFPLNWKSTRPSSDSARPRTNSPKLKPAVQSWRLDQVQPFGKSARTIAS